MGECVLCYGKSGSGKSRSLLNFREDEILLVNVIGKRMPFPKKFKYELKSDNVQLIQEKLKAMPCKVAVIDDAGYLMTNTFMRSHGKGDQFALYNTIGDTMWALLRFIKLDLPDDVIVYMKMPKDCPMCPMAHYDALNRFRGCIDKSPKFSDYKDFMWNCPVPFLGG